jgi:hypothetical protein
MTYFDVAPGKIPTLKRSHNVFSPPNPHPGTNHLTAMWKTLAEVVAGVKRFAEDHARLATEG